MQWSYDNQFLLFGVRTDELSMDLYLANRKTLQYTKIDNGVCGYFYWAPNQLRFCYAAGKYHVGTEGIPPSIYEVDPETGKARLICRSERGAGGYAWLNDGRHILARGLLLDVETGQFTPTRMAEGALHDCTPAPDGSGFLYERGIAELWWLPAQEGERRLVWGKDPDSIAPTPSWLEWPARWSPDSRAYFGGGVTVLGLVDLDTWQVVLYPRRGTPYTAIDYWYWSQDSQKLLTVDAEAFQDDPRTFEYMKSNGIGTIGVIDRKDGKYTPLGFPLQPRLAEEVGEDVDGAGFSVWSADGTRFVMGRVPYDEHCKATILPERYEWVEWSGGEFKKIEVPAGHVPVFPRESNQMDFLPKAYWIWNGLFKKGK